MLLWRENWIERLENIGLDNILEMHEDAQGEEVSLV